MCVLYVSLCDLIVCLSVSPRYHKQFMIDQQSLNKMEENITIPKNEDTTAVNLLLGQFLAVSLSLHLLRIKNGTADELVAIEGRPYGDMILNLNCDPQIADKDFLAKVQKSDNRTQEAFESCKPRSDDQRKSLVHWSHCQDGIG